MFIYLSNNKTRSVIYTKESDGIDDPMEKIAIKSHSDHSDSGIGKMLILIDANFVYIIAMQLDDKVNRQRQSVAQCAR